MKDMDIIDLTNLSASDLMKFHFSNVGGWLLHFTMGVLEWMSFLLVKEK
jgi:hypothetical protein